MYYSEKNKQNEKLKFCSHLFTKQKFISQLTLSHNKKKYKPFIYFKLSITFKKDSGENRPSISFNQAK